MKYEILESRELVTVETTVKYTFPDDSELEVKISHFQPEDEAAIVVGIENRYVSELRNKLIEQKEASEPLAEVAVAELITYDATLETKEALGLKVDDAKDVEAAK